MLSEDGASLFIFNAAQASEMEISDPSCWFPHYPGKCSEKMCLGMTPGAGGPGLGSPPGLQQGLAAPGLCRRKEPPLGHLSIALSLSPLRHPAQIFIFSVKLYHIHCKFVNIFRWAGSLPHVFSALCHSPRAFIQSYSKILLSCFP